MHFIYGFSVLVVDSAAADGNNDDDNGHNANADADEMWDPPDEM